MKRKARMLIFSMVSIISFAPLISCAPEEGPVETIKTATLKITTDDNGVVTASKTTELKEGDKVTLTVTPNNEYELDILKFNNSAVTVTDNKVEVTLIAGENTVNATFKKVQTEPEIKDATLKITTDDNGVVTASKTTELKEGDKVTLTVTPNNGYELSTLKFNGNLVTVVENKVEVTLIAGENTVDATFKITEVVPPIENKASVILTVDEHVTVTGVKNGDEFEEGEVITFEVNTVVDYVIKSITIGGIEQTISENNRYSYTVTKADCEKGNITIVIETEHFTVQAQGSVTIGGANLPTSVAKGFEVRVGESSSRLTKNDDVATFTIKNIDGKTTSAIELVYDDGVFTKTFTTEEFTFDTNKVDINIDLPADFFENSGVYFNIDGKDIVVPFTKKNDNSNQTIYEYTGKQTVDEDFQFTYKLKYSGPNSLVNEDGTFAENPFNGILGTGEVFFELQMWGSGTGFDMFPYVKYNAGSDKWTFGMSSGISSKEIDLSSEVIKALNTDGILIKFVKEASFITLSIEGFENTSLVFDCTGYDLPGLRFVDAHTQFNNVPAETDFSTLENYTITYSEFAGFAYILDNKVDVKGNVSLYEGVDVARFDELIENAYFISPAMEKFDANVNKNEDGTYTFDGYLVPGNYYLRIQDEESKLAFESLEYLNVTENGLVEDTTTLYSAFESKSSQIVIREGNDEVLNISSESDSPNNSIATLTARLKDVDLNNFFNEDGSFKNCGTFTFELRIWLSGNRNDVAGDTSGRFNVFLEKEDNKPWHFWTDWRDDGLNCGSDLSESEIRAFLTDGLTFCFTKKGEVIQLSTLDYEGNINEHLALNCSERTDLFIKTMNFRDRTNPSEKPSDYYRVVSNVRILKLKDSTDLSVLKSYHKDTEGKMAFVKTNTNDETGEVTYDSNWSGEKSWCTKGGDYGSSQLFGFKLHSDAIDTTGEEYKGFYILRTWSERNMEKLRVGFSRNKEDKLTFFIATEDTGRYERGETTITRELDVENNTYSEIEATEAQQKLISSEGLQFYIVNDYHSDTKYHFYVDNGFGGQVYLGTITLKTSNVRACGYEFGTIDIASNSNIGSDAYLEIRDHTVYTYAYGNTNTTIDELVNKVKEYKTIVEY